MCKKNEAEKCDLKPDKRLSSKSQEIFGIITEQNSVTLQTYNKESFEEILMWECGKL